MKEISYKPTLDPETTRVNMSSLIRTGEIIDPDLHGRIRRLRGRFRVYADTYPFGLWAPGLAITDEMRRTTDPYLAVKEITSAMDRLIRLSLKYPFLSERSPLHGMDSWLDLLHLFRRLIASPDPVALLRQLMLDQEFRIRFLFSLFLPQRHGADFDRYPLQKQYLREWLKKNFKNRQGSFLRCLDTACATGESAYELVMVLLEEGLTPASFLVHSSTLDPLELFAAAHVHFPHDCERQNRFRSKVGPVFASGSHERMAFFLEDLTEQGKNSNELYDIILCNGLLGGPGCFREKDIRAAIANLSSRLRHSGVILAADRFHDGWKKKIPRLFLQGIFRDHGFRTCEVDGGLAAEKERR